MANPQFYTRIQLKYDKWENWNTAAALAKVPLKGEVCLVEVPGTGTSNLNHKDATSVTKPAVLMKVGDGATTFGELPWLSAKAADVHEWAKQDVDDFKTWLDETAGFATDAELAAVSGAVEALANRVTPLETAKTDHEIRLGDLEAALGTGGSTENSISKRVEALEDSMETVQGADSVEGSIANAKKAGTDAAAAASTADGKAVAAQNAVDAVELQLTGIAAGNGTVKAAIDAAAAKGQGAQDAIDAVEEVLEGYTTKGSVASAINGLDGRLDAAEGTLESHTTQLTTLTGDVNTAGSVDYKIAQEVAKIINDNDAADIDTLEEIASWITNDTTGAAGMAKDITALKAVTEGYSGSKAIQNAINGVDGKAVAAQNAVDAVELQLTGIDAGNGTVKAAIDAAAKKGTDAQADVDAVEKVLSGYTAEGSVKSAIEAAASAASTADGKAVAAQNAADNAQSAVDAVELQLVGMAATSGSVKSAIDAAAAKGQGAQDAVDAVELQLTGIAAGNGTVKAAIDAVDGKVTALDTKVEELTLDQINSNTTANYVVFNCGSASVLI